MIELTDFPQPDPARTLHVHFEAFRKDGHIPKALANILAWLQLMHRGLYNIHQDTLMQCQMLTLLIIRMPPANTEGPGSDAVSFLYHDVAITSIVYPSGEFTQKFDLLQSPEGRSSYALQHGVGLDEFELSDKVKALVQAIASLLGGVDGKHLLKDDRWNTFVHNMFIRKLKLKWY